MSKSSSSPQSINATSLEPVALNVQGGEAPEWIELIPAGVEVKGFDGRRWLNDQPDAVVTATQRTLPVPLDWEHATEVRGSQGLDAPAAAWIEEVEQREGGAIWGRVSWTPRGRDQVVNREYRFVSPGFRAERTSGRILRLVHAGLTNTPNLPLTALNREGLQREPLENTLDIALLRKALGLPDDASDDAILAAATAATAAAGTAIALNRPVDLTTYAPRAEVTTALNRAQTAEAELKAVKDAEVERNIETALNKAQDEGKVTPHTVDDYRAMCRQEGGLARFEALAAKLPPIAGAAATRSAAKIDKVEGSTLSAEEIAVCRVMGQSEEDFIAAKAMKGV